MKIPYFCSDCESELHGHGVQMKDKRVICRKCAAKIKRQAESKKQRSLFVEQKGLFENPNQQNIAMGFYNATGFHPIRASKDYNEFLAGDFDTDRQRTRRKFAKESQQREQYKKEEEWYAKHTKKKHRGAPKSKSRSLSQFVRSVGGMTPGGMYAGEVKRLGYRETGTTGLINQHARQGAHKQTPEYVMDAANVEGFRDKAGRKFGDIGAFLEAVEMDATGRRKSYSYSDDARYNNSMKRTATKNKAVPPARFPATTRPKQVVKVPRVRDIDSGQEGTVLAKVGHLLKVRWDNRAKASLIDPDQVAKANPKRKRFVVVVRISETKKNKKNPQDRLKPTELAHLRSEFAKLNDVDLTKYRGAFHEVFAGVRSPLLKQLAEAKIEWVSSLAKNALMRRQRNPKKNPLHPLEIGSHVAIILSGLEQVRNMIRRGKAKRRRSVSPKKNLGLISLVENLQAAEYIGRKLKSKKRNPPAAKAKNTKPNPNNGKLFEKFTGQKSEHVETGYMWPGPAPKNIDQLGRLTEIHLSNPGEKINISKCGRGHGPCHCPPNRVLRFSNNPAKLCATQPGSGKPRFVIALKKRFEIPRHLNPAVDHDYGQAHTVVYEAKKPHLYGHDKTITFYHDLGEEGGRMPHLILTNGLLKFKGGDYTIEREGIRN